MDPSKRSSFRLRTQHASPVQPSSSVPQPERTLSFPRNARAFSASASTPVPPASFPNPSPQSGSRFNRVRAFLAEDENPSEPGPNAHVMESDSSQSSLLSNEEKEDHRGSPPLSSLNIKSESLVDNDLDFDDEEYSMELEQHFGKRFAHIEDILDGLWEMSKAPEQLQTEFQSLQEDVQRKHSALVKERKKYAFLEEELDSIRDALNTSKAHERNATENAMEVTKTKEALLAKYQQLHEKAESLDTTIKSERSKYASLTETMRSELGSMDEKLQEHKKSIVEKGAELHQVKQELTYVQERFEAEVVNREAIASERDVQLAKVEKLQDSVEKEKKRFAVAAKLQETELQKLQLEVVESRVMYTAEQGQNLQHQTNIKGLQLQISKQQTNIEGLQHQITQQQAKFIELQLVNAQQQNTVNEMRADRTHQLEIITQQEGEISELRSQSKHNHEQFSELQHTKKKQENNFVSLKSSFETSTAENIQLRQVLTDIDENVQAIKALQKNFSVSVQMAHAGTGIIDILAALNSPCFAFNESLAENDGNQEMEKEGNFGVGTRVKLLKDCLKQQLLHTAERELILSRCLSMVKGASEQIRGPLLKSKEVLEDARRAKDVIKKGLDATTTEVVAISDVVKRMQENLATVRQNAEDSFRELKASEQIQYETMQKELLFCRGALDETRGEMQKAQTQEDTAFADLQKKWEGCEQVREKSVRELELCQNTLQAREEELRSRNSSESAALIAMKMTLESERLTRESMSKELNNYKTKLREAEEHVAYATDMAHGANAEAEKKLNAIMVEKASIFSAKEDLAAKLNASESEKVIAVESATKYHKLVRALEAKLGTHHRRLAGHSPAVDTHQQQLTQEPIQTDAKEGTAKGLLNQDNVQKNEAVDTAVKASTKKETGDSDPQTVHTTPRSKKRQQTKSVQKVIKTKKSRGRASRVGKEEGDGPSGKGRGRSQAVDGEDDDDWLINEHNLRYGN